MVPLTRHGGVGGSGAVAVQIPWRPPSPFSSSSSFGIGGGWKRPATIEDLRSGREPLRIPIVGDLTRSQSCRALFNIRWSGNAICSGDGLAYSNERSRRREISRRCLCPPTAWTLSKQKVDECPRKPISAHLRNVEPNCGIMAAGLFPKRLCRFLYRLTEKRFARVCVETQMVRCLEPMTTTIT